MTITTQALTRRNGAADKPNEDAYAARLDQDQSILVVADGVTRSRGADGSYPDPSGAAVAARIVTQTLASALAADGPPDFAHAFALANRAVGAANANAGVVARLDYRQHDLWCAVATAAVIRAGRVHWGHIGDSALLIMPPADAIRVCTPDQVADAARFLATLSAKTLAAAGGREPYARRWLRNRPGVAGTYGALTGEPAAERFVVTGDCALAPGDTVILLTDGLGSLRTATPNDPWRHLGVMLRMGVPLARVLNAVERADAETATRSDDKTIITAAIG